MGSSWGPVGSVLRPRWRGAWPTHRLLFALAGAVALSSAVLAALVSPWWLLLTAVAGANQLLFAGVGWCPVSLAVDAARGAGSVRDEDEEVARCSSTTTR
jgi:hypothetical protein